MARGFRLRARDRRVEEVRVERQARIAPGQQHPRDDHDPVGALALEFGLHRHAGLHEDPRAAVAKHLKAWPSDLS